MPTAPATSRAVRKGQIRRDQAAQNNTVFHIPHSAKAVAPRRGRNEHSCANTDRSPHGSKLPGRSEMVTTLITQMSDLLAPISKSTTPTESTCANGSVRGISLE
jgi:hypothetical protein